MTSATFKTESPTSLRLRRERVGSAQLFSDRFIIKMLEVGSATALATLTVTENTGAAIVPTAADIPASQALGAAQDDTVWYRGSVNGNTVTGSATLIRGQDFDWVITAAHNVRFQQGTLNTSNMTIGNGKSYISDPGTTSVVSFMFISPTYLPGSDAGQDYAFLRLERRISPPNLVFTLGTAPENGDSILFAGYGLPGSMQEGTLPKTGNVMGFFGRYSPSEPPGWNSADDTGYFTGQHDSGVGNGGDSGGSVKRLNPSTGRWENLGTMIGSNLSNFTNFIAYYNADQDFQDFLVNTVRPATAVSVSPKLACTVTSTAVQLQFSNLEFNREYRVMRSSTLSAWEEAYRFTAATTSGLWSDALAPAGQRFYRLEWNQ
ncbi:MAG: trypsin-like serine protease [Verrucomicrobia bacterium]|nr:trypsin-like serine protease [Verrucomicrobiota bacterium]